MTIGALADQVGLRKSTLFGLYGSKEELQLQTLRLAAQHFAEHVWSPVEGRPPGRRRLLALCDSWLAYHESESLPGGCFLTTATVEYDARPGPLHDEVERTMANWLGILEREAEIAVEAGELAEETDPADLAFALNALAAAASYGFQLSRSPEAFARARRSMHRLLEPGPETGRAAGRA